jgi:hypothetical protein
MVLTIDGSYMPVNEVITNHVQKEILEIDTDFSVSPTRCTKEHEVFTVTRINKY